MLALMLFQVGLALAATLVNGGFESGLTGWTCGDCETGSDYPYAGSAYALRPADDTLSQAVDLDCDSYRVFWAARQYSAGTFLADIDFATCGTDPVSYTPAEPGETWSLHYVDVDTCEGDTALSVAFSGSGANDLDAVSVTCSGAAPLDSGWEIGALSDDTPVVISPSATFGDLANFSALFAVAALLFISLLVRIFFR